MENENQEGTQGAAEQENTEMTAVEVDAAFDEGAGSETEVVDVEPVGGINDKEEVNAAAASEADDETAKAAAAAVEKEAAEKTAAAAEPTLAELQAENERLTKEAADNQKYGRGESEKNTALVKELAELKADQQETFDPLDGVSDDVKEYLADNPEVQTIVEKLADQLVSKKLGGMDPATVSQELVEMRASVGQMNFFNAISMGFMNEKGEHIPGHQDATNIVHSTEFKAFVETEKANVEEISAGEAINLISKFKTSKAAAAAAGHDANKGKKDRKQAQDYSGAAGGNLGTSTKEGTGKGPSDDTKSGDDWFNEGATEEAQTMQ